jgi:hypothetical protein
VRGLDVDVEKVVLEVEIVEKVAEEVAAMAEMGAVVFLLVVEIAEKKMAEIAAVISGMTWSLPNVDLLLPTFLEYNHRCE